MYVLSQVGAAFLRDGEPQYPGECDFTESMVMSVGTYGDVCGVVPDAVDAIYRVPSVVRRPGGTKKAPDLSGAFKVAITYSSAFAVPSA